MPSPLLSPLVGPGSLATCNYTVYPFIPKIGDGDIPGNARNILTLGNSTTNVTGTASQLIGNFTPSIVTGISISGSVATLASPLLDSINTGISISGAASNALGNLSSTVISKLSISGIVSNVIANFTQLISVVFSIHHVAPLKRTYTILFENRNQYNSSSPRVMQELGDSRLVSPTDDRVSAIQPESRNLIN